jgi:molybdopterin-guanine dinucleotide biosynthesis adapter protein
MTPIISIVGRSKSGKTTLLEKLLVELKSRGYRIATMKHTPMGMASEDSDKDSERHLKAGSEATIICDPTRLVMIKPVTEASPLEEIARFFEEDYDLIITEGFKQDDAPKIEVHRKNVAPALKDIKNIIAVATDEKLDIKVRQFALEDIKGIADLIEDGFIKPQQERLVMYTNGQAITLTAFPREIINNMLLAMASSLKGVDKVKTLKIFLKRQ